MSEGEGGGAMFPFPFRERTPEEQSEHEKRRMERLAEGSRKLAASLPHLRDAQRGLREAAALGIGGEHFTKAQKHVAVLVEQVETDLVRPA